MVKMNVIQELLGKGKKGFHIELDSILNNTSRDLYPRGRVGTSGWKVTKRCRVVWAGDCV